MARLILRSPVFPSGKQLFTDDDLPLTIGRSHRADIVINDQQLSRVHAEFRFSVAGRFEIADLESTNLTIVNGHDVESVELKTGDRILLGETELMVEVEYPEGDIHEVTTRELPLVQPDEE